MGQDTRIRENPQSECIPTVPRLDGLAGWCDDCTDDIRYHLGGDDGICLICGCNLLVSSSNLDELDATKGHLLPKEVELEDLQDLQSLIPVDDILEVTEVEQDTIWVKIRRMYWGRVSRECRRCGYQKLYKEFGNSIDPSTLCKSCDTEKEQLDMLALMDEMEQEELEGLQYQIRLNEYKYEAAQERQEFIDQVLKDLDG